LLILPSFSSTARMARSSWSILADYCSLGVSVTIYRPYSRAISYQNCRR
jgi:hypothetical protein